MRGLSYKRLRSYTVSLTRNSRIVLYFMYVLLAISAFVSLISVLGVGDQPELTVGRVKAASVFLTVYSLGGIVLIIPNFRELYDRQYSDVEFSLPMSAKERFLAKLRLVLLRHILPFCALIFTLMMLVTALSSEPDGRRAAFCVLLNLCGSIVFVDCVTLFCVSFCASIAECLFSTAAFIAVISALPKEILKLFMPFEHSVYTFGLYFVGENKNAINYPSYPEIIRLVLENIAVSVMLLFIGYRIYIRRNGLRSGTPFGSKVIFIVTAAGISIASMLLGTTLGSFFVQLVSGLIGEVILSLTSNRGVTPRTLIAQTCGFHLGLQVVVFVINQFTPAVFM